MSPIKPENKDRYPDNWSEISLAIKERAGWRCECEGECGSVHGPGLRRCQRRHGETFWTASGHPVILTVAHLDHTPENCDNGNLKAMCQSCHLCYDAPRKKADRIAASAGSEPLFEGETA